MPRQLKRCKTACCKKTIKSCGKSRKRCQTLKRGGPAGSKKRYSACATRYKRKAKAKRKPAAKKPCKHKWSYPKDYLRQDGCLKKAYRGKAVEYRKKYTQAGKRRKK